MFFALSQGTEGFPGPKGDDGEPGDPGSDVSTVTSKSCLANFVVGENVFECDSDP